MRGYKNYKPRQLQQSRNSNTKKKVNVKPMVLSLLKPAQFFAKHLPIVAILVLIFSIGLSAFLYFYYYSFVPGEEHFSSCKSLFVKIKEKPTYGIMVDVGKDKVEALHILGVNQSTGVVSINIKAENWVNVYFSETFLYSQTSELLRLSRLETGNTNYCWLAEQVSLLTGVPLEFLVVRESGIPTVSNIKMYEFLQIYNQFTKGTKNEINWSLVNAQVLDDGSKVNVLSFNAIRDQFPDLFKIQEITNEQAFVEVYNSSTISGYASLVSHKLTMLGIEVSRVGNTAAPEENVDAIVYVKNREQYSKTLELVTSALPTGGKVIIRDGRPSNLVTTGDIVVILLKR